MGLPKKGEELSLIANNSLSFESEKFRLPSGEFVKLVFCPSADFRRSNQRLKKNEIYKVTVEETNQELLEKGSIIIYVKVEAKVLTHFYKGIEMKKFRIKNFFSHLTPVFSEIIFHEKDGPEVIAKELVKSCERCNIEIPFWFALQCVHEYAKNQEMIH